MGVVEHSDEVFRGLEVDGFDRVELGERLGEWGHDFITNGGHGPEIYLVKPVTRHCQTSQYRRSIAFARTGRVQTQGVDNAVPGALEYPVVWF